MRLIRSVLRPAKFRMPLQLQQGQVETSSARLCPVLIETSNHLVHETSMQCRGKSNAASAQSDRLEARKERRRVSKDERKAMVENFVNKYMEMNAGKFPTASDAQKDVGGSYYVIRKILQEIKYNAVMPSIDAKDATVLEKRSVKKDEISKSYESEEEPRSSISIQANLKDETLFFSVQSGKSKDVETQSNISSDEPKINLQSDSENNIKQGTIHEEKLKVDGLQPKAEPHESAETEISGRKWHKVPTEDEEHQRKSTVWQNLKAFANGILSIWK